MIYAIATLTIIVIFVFFISLAMEISLRKVIPYIIYVLVVQDFLSAFDKLQWQASVGISLISGYILLCGFKTLSLFKKTVLLLLIIISLLIYLK